MSEGTIEAVAAVPRGEVSAQLRFVEGAASVRHNGVFKRETTKERMGQKQQLARQVCCSV